MWAARYSRKPLGWFIEIGKWYFFGWLVGCVNSTKRSVDVLLTERLNWIWARISAVHTLIICCSGCHWLFAYERWKIAHVTSLNVNT